MVDAISATDATTKTTAGRTSLISNYETYLSLLTAQLKNQDPLSPVDSSQFTQQLTQMSGVEQQLLTNDLLTSLLSAQNASGMTGASTYIGKDVTAVWSADKLTNGQAKWSYELGANAQSATLAIVDSTGKTVWTGPAPDRTEGVHDFVWDGKTTGGGQLSDGGVYTLKVTAKNGDAAVSSQVLTRGVATGVEMYDGAPYLTVGNSIVPLTSVISLKQAAV